MTLVLGRKTSEAIEVRGPDGSIITIVVIQIRGRQVRLGVDAPANMRIVRRELFEQPARCLTFEEIAEAEPDDDDDVLLECQRRAGIGPATLTLAQTAMARRALVAGQSVEQVAETLHVALSWSPPWPR